MSSPTTPVVHNPAGEKIDCLFENPFDQKNIVIFSHGFGVTKHESYGFFDDYAAALHPLFATFRFDYSSCGDSEGQQRDLTYSKQAADLSAVIDFVHTTYPEAQLFIAAHSMGCFIASLVNSPHISRAVFTGIPNSDTAFIIQRITARFASRPGAIINLDGVSSLPRSSGKVQELGAGFWQELRAFDPIETVTQFNQHCPTLIIHPKQDDVVGLEHMEEYAQIPRIAILKLDGDHSIQIPEQRRTFIEFAKFWLTKDM